MENYSEYDLIAQAVNKLFVYTDTQDWKMLQDEVFTETVQFDMSSLGGQRAMLRATEICAIWQAGFAGIDAINHLAGNYLIDIAGNNATVFAYATATHYKKAATKGTTREFVGTYDLTLVRHDNKWKVDSFRYNLKYATGNLDLI
jgi:SnoaL-like protein